ncbi:MAG: hypothetical protein ACR2PA_05180 [Hyphomicrobiaceae bacterium]
MAHAVEKYFKQAYDQAISSYQPPPSSAVFEQNIGLKAHIARVMPIFATLRDSEGKALVTAMLPPQGSDEDDMRPIIVAHENSDPYVDYEEAIEAIANHYGLILERAHCFPYARQ